MTAPPAGRWRRRDVLRTAALPLAVLPRLTPAAADPATSLPLAVSLQQEIAAALRSGRALVVMVSLHGCPFCRVVRESHLAPMRRDTGQPIVQVDMLDRRTLLDVDGRRTSHAARVTAWKVRVAPTVLFLGAGGRELAPRLEGASIPDYYGGYLDDRVQAANRAAS